MHDDLELRNYPTDLDKDIIDRCRQLYYTGKPNVRWMCWTTKGQTAGFAFGVLETEEDWPLAFEDYPLFQVITHETGL